MLPNGQIPALVFKCKSSSKLDENEVICLVWPQFIKGFLY